MEPQKTIVYDGLCRSEESRNISACAEVSPNTDHVTCVPGYVPGCVPGYVPGYVPGCVSGCVPGCVSGY